MKWKNINISKSRQTDLSIGLDLLMYIYTLTGINVIKMVGYKL
jgi:hypothetical protein